MRIDHSQLVIPFKSGRMALGLLIYFPPKDFADPNVPCNLLPSVFSFFSNAFLRFQYYACFHSNDFFYTSAFKPFPGENCATP